jgi:hypothetical protein
MVAVEVQHFLGRARDFLQGADLMKEDLDQYRYSAALLGIHAAISYSDAMRIGLGSKKLSSDDHRQAAEDLKSLLGARKHDSGHGIDRFRRLLGYKSRIAYAQSASGMDFGKIVEDALRFAVWAEKAGETLRIEGWRDE